MSATVTDAARRIAEEGFGSPLARVADVVVAIALIVLLIERQLASASSNERSRRRVGPTLVAIVPLLAAFTVIVLSRFFNVR